MKRIGISLLCGAACAWSTPSRAALDYTLSVDTPAKSVRVSLTMDAQPGPLTCSIPEWCPGFYVLKGYRAKIYDVKLVSAAGEPLKLAQNGSNWSTTIPSAGDYTLSYRVLGDDPGLGFFGTSVKDASAFVNGPSAFMYVAGRKTEKCSLTIKPPTGWDRATPAAVDEKGQFQYANYDELLDHPIQLGRMTRKAFKVAGIPFEAVVVSPDGRAPNMDQLVNSLKATSEPAIALFGGAPFKNYTFFLHLQVGDFAGGLEHRASNVIAVDYDDALTLGTLAGHEFFHAWNVKQIRPQVLGPFDYTQKVRTRNLWFAEGVTEYYAQTLAVPAGLYGEEDLLSALGAQIVELQSSRSRLNTTLDNACMQTWESGGFGYGDLSYYTKGSLAGFLFDAAIRDSTDGAKSLDDVMRLLYERHKLPKPGYAEDELRKTISEVAGRDLGPLYDRMVRSTQELPYEMLAKIGLTVVDESERAFLGAVRGNGPSVGRYVLRRIENPDARTLRLYGEWLQRSKPSTR